MAHVYIGEGHSSEEGIVDDYDEFTRMSMQPERAPINAYYGTQLACISNEAGEALMVPEGSEGRFQCLRGFVEMVRRRCWRMAAKMNCAAAAAGEVVQPAPPRSGSSCATASDATTSASAAGDEEEDEEHDEEDDEAVHARLPDELILADLVGASTVTQLTQATPPHRKCRDRADISSVNVVEGTRGQHLAGRFTPGTGAHRKCK